MDDPGIPSLLDSRCKPGHSQLRHDYQREFYMLNPHGSTHKLIAGIQICALTLFLFLCIDSLTIAEGSDASDKGKVLSLETGYIGESIIYLTEEGKSLVKNDLTFYIMSGRSGSDGSSEAIPAKPNESYIKLSFEYGDGIGDLATAQDAIAFELSMLRHYDNEFEIKKYPKGTRPYWMLTARSLDFLKGGSKNRIELQFSNMFSSLKPGLTTLQVEYGKIPGFQDGYRSLTIVKQEPKAVQAKYGLDVGDVNLVEKEKNLEIKGSIKLQNGGIVSGFSDDTGLSENSSTNVPTEKAVKTYVDTTVKAYVDYRLPAGVIVMWSGAVDKVPAGWALCDGRNGTPNLLNTFVLSSGKRKVGEKGGAENVVLTAAQMPRHTHSANASSVSVNEPAFRTEKIQHFLNSNRQYSHAASQVTKPVYVSISATGNNNPHNNMPPYFVLAYIMKLPDSPAN